MRDSINRTSSTLTFFFDGACPLCTKEVRLLRSWDVRDVIHFVDLTNESEMKKFPQIDVSDAMQSLYAFKSNGKTLRGIDATYEAWDAVGKGHWVKPLQWRWFRPFAQVGYRIFARYRHGIALLLTGKARNQYCGSSVTSSCRYTDENRRATDDRSASE